MPSKTTEKDEPKIDLVKARAEGLTLLAPLQQKMSALHVRDAADYLIADQALAQVALAEKAWLGKIDPPIAHIRAGLDMLYSLKNDVLKPLQSLKDDIKGKMKAFKEEERRQLRLIEEGKERERQRLLKEAADLKAKEENAKTKARQNQLIEQRAAVEQEAEDIRTAPVEGPVKGTGSSTRYPLRCRVVDLGLLMAHILEAPTDMTSLIEVAMGELEALRRLQDPPVPVGMWLPGVEVYEDISIATRGSR